MSFLWAMICMAFGLATLMAGGQSLVHGASNLATRMGVPPIIIGLTVVALGTSAPEFIVSLTAALRGQDAIAVGNVVGSNIVNILIGLGAPALIATLSLAGVNLKKDVLIMLAVTALAAFTMSDGTVNKAEGGVMILAGLIYMLMQIKSARSETVQKVEIDARKGAVGVIAIIMGLVTLPLGAYSLVYGASSIARIIGISDAVIGLTIVAVGTSMPEIMTGLIAAKRGKAALAWGNVIGSNIFNILFILGLSSLITPLSVAPAIIWRDIPVMLVTAVGLVLLIFGEFELRKKAGKAMLIAFGVYTVVLVFMG